MLGPVDAADRDVHAMGRRLRVINDRLKEEYGEPRWHAHGPPLDVLIGTILSQHTSDTNTARAFASLRARFPDWRDVITASASDVADAIRVGGLANIKAPRIQRVLRVIADESGDLSLTFLRELPLGRADAWLRNLPGVGPKTSACVLLFSLGLPAMPVDTHVHRVSCRLGLIDADCSAEDAHAVFRELLGPDRDLTYALHLNLIEHGRRVCKARSPACHRCVLADICPSAPTGDRSAAP